MAHEFLLKRRTWLVWSERLRGRERDAWVRRKEEEVLGGVLDGEFTQPKIRGRGTDLLRWSLVQSGSRRRVEEGCSGSSSRVSRGRSRRFVRSFSQSPCFSIDFNLLTDSDPSSSFSAHNSQLSRSGAPASLASALSTPKSHSPTTAVS